MEKARGEINTLLNKLKADFGFDIVCEALEKERGIFLNSKYNSFKSDDRDKPLTDIFRVVKQKQHWNDGDDGGYVKVIAEIGPTVEYNYFASCDGFEYELGDCNLKFNSKTYELFEDTQQTIDSILEMYKFLDFKDVTVGDFIEIVSSLSYDAPVTDDLSLSDKDLDICISNCSDEPAPKKRKL